MTCHDDPGRKGIFYDIKKDFWYRAFSVSRVLEQRFAAEVIKRPEARSLARFVVATLGPKRMTGRMAGTSTSVFSA